MSDNTSTPADWTDEDVRRAREIWQRYQEEHDVSGRKGQTAGIDPRTGEVWFGESIIDISGKRRALGLTTPLFFERVGYPTSLRKRQFDSRSVTAQAGVLVGSLDGPSDLSTASKYMQGYGR